METPCPAQGARSLHWQPYAGSRLSSIPSNILGEETETGAIDYTRAVQQEFRNAKPRRRQTQARSDKSHAAVTIFEDIDGNQELSAQPHTQHRTQTTGGTLLGRPAQRIRRPQKDPTNLSPPDQRRQGIDRSRSHPLDVSEHARAGSTRLSPNQPNQTTKRQPKDDALKKEPRRRTIFVPSDDTTFMTIHPGHAADTQALDDTFQLPTLAPARPEKRVQASPQTLNNRMSMTRPSQKVPLQENIRTGTNVAAIDKPGDGEGKENVPPVAMASRIGRNGLTDKSGITTKRQRPGASAPKAHQFKALRTAAPKPPVRTRSPLLQPSPQQQAVAQVTWSETRKPAVWQSQQQHARKRVCKPTGPPSPSSFAQWKSSQRPASSRSVATTNPKLAQYPVLCEDVPQPALYEDNWLSHQEVALTEVVNEILRRSSRATQSSAIDGANLRTHVMTLYHQEEVSMMHRRLQASISCGSLGRPVGSLNATDLTLDLGLRRRYLSTLLDTYPEDHLTVAAEVVVGRQAHAGTGKHFSALKASESLLDSYNGRRTLIGFLETFFVQADDNEVPLDGHVDAKFQAAARWQKTMLRTFMLVWLLDQSKSLGVIDSCLFKGASTHKSSTAVLHTLVTLLNPSIGDPLRTLRQYDYKLAHVQDPLDEVEYRIDNLAVDLRDGVLLARLVETLLPEKNGMDLELSQGLKMPCLGRAQKVHNVQIALGALQDHDATMAAGVTADNIVDGHREKTLSLLWSLVSGGGLDQLVDWTDLIRETERAKSRGQSRSTRDHEVASQEEQDTKGEDLLFAWAAANCSSRDITLPNLTSAFADGRAYTAIIEAFGAFLPDGHERTRPSPSASPMATLQNHLDRLGCSNAFTSQLCASRAAIPSHNTTISNLAFLASRLLPLAKHHNAAATIQRAYRNHRARVTVTQRVSLMQVASACATVVQTRNRMIWAATVMQRGWRSVLAARIEALEEDARRFQVLARGWFVRRAVKAEVRAKADRVRAYW